MSDFTKINIILNGYWYTFEYIPSNHTNDYDRFPFIFCVQPSENNLNNFVGLNLHHLSYSERKQFIKYFDEISKFSKKESRTIITLKDLLRLYPKAKNAIRYYNRKNMLNIYKVSNNVIKDYISYEGNILQNNNEKNHSY